MNKDKKEQKEEVAENNKERTKDESSAAIIKRRLIHYGVDISQSPPFTPIGRPAEPPKYTKEEIEEIDEVDAAISMLKQLRTDLYNELNDFLNKLLRDSDAKCLIQSKEMSYDRNGTFIFDLVSHKTSYDFHILLEQITNKANGLLKAYREKASKAYSILERFETAKSAMDDYFDHLGSTETGLICRHKSDSTTPNRESVTIDTVEIQFFCHLENPQ